MSCNVTWTLTVKMEIFLQVYIYITLILNHVFLAEGGNYSDPHCYTGRSVIAQLFEWKWSEVAAECETFLSQHNFCGVQISPPHENRVLHQPNRPWWERYQPVSYLLETRSGNEADLEDMIRRCNAVNVRIYVDMIINNMADTRNHGLGTAYSPYHGEQRTYPKVPYSGWDFHDTSDCFTKDLEVHNYSDPMEVRSCQHNHLADLNLGKPWVQEKITEAMNHLIDLGIAGFYINNAKYISPDILRTIYSNLNHLNSTFFAAGIRPFIYHQFQEINGDAITSSEYTGLGKVASYRYGPQISAVFRHVHNLNTITSQMNGWALAPSSDAVVFIDDQYTQREPSHTVISMIQNSREYSMAVAFMLAHPYGLPRIISSYRWTSNIVNGSDIGADAGPPSQDTRTCTGNWLCEHRQNWAKNMVEFRMIAGSSGLSHLWSNTAYQLAFSRGNRGFIVFNADRRYDVNHYIQTGLPYGHYCDVISGSREHGRCTGTTIEVRYDGTAKFHINRYSGVPMIAIHIGARV